MSFMPCNMNMLYGLVDCNNFYVSCERVFNPVLHQRPVVVLSSNDGCIISRSDEAKALGIKMGEPYFTIEKKNMPELYICSANFSLYRDMSRRVMMGIAAFAEPIEIVSVDEAFLDISYYPDPEKFAHRLRHTIKQWTGIPVTIGLGPTKTLAKLANTLAKRNPSHAGVCHLAQAAATHPLCQTWPVEDIWGIGPKLSKKMHKDRIDTIQQLLQKPNGWLRKAYGVTGLRTVEELRGRVCFPLMPIPQGKKTLTMSRSFGKKLFRKEDIKEAFIYFTNQIAYRLRQERQLTSSCYISLYRNLPGACSMPACKDHGFIHFRYPTDSTMEIMNRLLKQFETIYRPNYGYKKCAITLYNLTEKQHFTKQCFEKEEDRKQQQKCLQAIDDLNAKMGRSMVRVGVSEGKGIWLPKSSKKSPCYTTKWQELPKVA